MPDVPVIALTGFLGAGKTTLLNHVLSTPRARIGVVINDFGAVNVDAQWVTGQVDEAASIAGGCICCLPDDGQLDQALAKLADPRLGLDAIIVEASGVADPVALARIVGFSTVPGVRPGGVVDVIDAVTHFDTVDRDHLPPARYGAASLVVLNKLDLVAADQRDAIRERIQNRVRSTNPDALLVPASHGRIDPSLLFDIAEERNQLGQLSFRDALDDLAVEQHRVHAGHVHADAVTVHTEGPVGAGALLDLLESPPPGVYRIKGSVEVRQRSRARRYQVNVVGNFVQIRPAKPNERTADGNVLVAIGMHFNTEAVRQAVETALAPSIAPRDAGTARRWRRYI